MEPDYNISATFGQALFPLELPDPNKVDEAASDFTLSPFQPTTPGLGSLLASSEFEHISRSETPALLYDFLPDPDQKLLESAVGPDFPRLYIQVRTGRDGNRPTIHKLSLGFEERVHDVLLPDQATDIRFHRYGRLRFTVKSHHDKNVQSWIEVVQQNIESGGRLFAPSLTIDIPKWTIPGFASDTVGQVSVKYHLAGIQFRQTAAGRFLDTQVSYSTLQSGKLGAKGDTLSAYPDKLSTKDYETQIRDFAIKCVDMVDYISQAGAQTQPPRQAVLPRNESSARKQRRAALQGGEQTVTSIRNEVQNQDLDQDFGSDQDELDIETETHMENVPSIDQQKDASLASRLDNAVPSTDAEDNLEAAFNEADQERRDDLNKVQKSQVDALLEDLFGAESKGEGGSKEEKVGEEETEGDKRA